MAFSVPRGPGGDSPGPVGGLRADGGVDLSGAGGMYLPRFFGDAGDGPAPEPARRPGVGLDAVAELDRLGCRRHPANGGSGVEVVPQQAGVEALPATPFVTHLHDVCHQDVVMDLRVASPGGGVAGHGPGQAVGRRPHLRPSAPPALLLYDLVQVRHRGLSFGIQDQVHVVGPADDSQLGHRLVRGNDQLHPRPQAVHEPLAPLGMASATGSEDRPPLVDANFAD